MFFFLFCLIVVQVESAILCYPRVTIKVVLSRVVSQAFIAFVRISSIGRIDDDCVAGQRSSADLVKL